MHFDSFGLEPVLLKNIARLGLVTPTPIQERAIPAVMEGRDLMGLAQTGTGKTAAFGLPLLHRLLQTPRRGRQPRALIIAPTRELATQILEALDSFARGTGIRTIAIFGGVAMLPQVRKLERGCDIIVACPGRLLDHLGRGHVDLSQLELLVLDEADQMFDMGFLPTIRRIVHSVPKDRQALLFSATMPDDIRLLARQLLGDPVAVEVANTAPVETVAHALYPVEASKKSGLLMHVLQHIDSDSVLVFTKTKHRAKRVAEDLEQRGHNAVALHGNLSQARRQAALKGFRDGSFRILVATDIAARGLDISSVSHVINYDMPDTPEAYTHRIGRTGRASRNGDAFTFVTREDSAMVRAVERILQRRIERRNVEGFECTETREAPRPATPRCRGRAQPQRGRKFQKGPHAHARGGRNRGDSPRVAE